MALAVPLSDPLQDPEGTNRCKNGHERTPENTVMRGGGRDNKPYPSCRLCRNEAVARVRQRQQGLNVPKMFLPRGSSRDDLPVATTATLFSLLPEDLRRRVAGLIMSAAAPPAVLYVLRIASERHVWHETSQHYAASMYIEEIAEMCVERDDECRVDKVLLALLG